MRHNILIDLLVGSLLLAGCAKERANPVAVPLAVPSWEKIEPQWTRIFSVAAYENQLLIGSDSARLFMSFNQGDSWQLLNTFDPNWKGYVAAIVHASPDKILVGTTANGAFQSNDRGVTWSPFTTLPGTRVNSIAIADSLVFAGSDSTIYRSTNGGQTWSAVLDSIAPYSLAIDRFGTVYAGLIQRGVFFSTDGGINWSHVPSTEFSNTELYVDPQGNIWRLTTNGGYQSTDGGATWTYRISFVAGANSLAVNSHGHLFVAGVAFGVRVSFDGGSTWSFSTNDEVSVRYIEKVVVDGSDRLFAATIYDIYRSLPLSQ